MSDATVQSGPTPALARTGFGLLMAALLAHIWFASAPLPFGGPNVLLFAVAAVLAAVTLALVAVRSPHGAGLGALAGRLRAIAPALCIGAMMPAVALTVYLWTSTVDVVRLGHMVLGLGVLLAVFVFVDTPKRARQLAFALVVATAASAAFGILVTLVGDPFLSIWLKVADVSEEDLQDILTFGRSAGLAAHVATFGRQLAVATPLALAALLYCDYPAGRRLRAVAATGLFVFFATLVTALLMNNTRSVALAAVVACTAVVLPVLRVRRARLRLLLAAGPLAAWLFLFFYPWSAPAEAPEAAQPSRVDDLRGDIAELRAGVEAWNAAALGLTGHALEGNTPGREYEVQLRERYAAGFGQASGVNAVADDEGRIFVTWRRREGVGYQERRRPTDYGEWSLWVDFMPSLAKPGQPVEVSQLRLEDVALGYRGEVSDGRVRIGHRFAQLGGDARQVMELRLVARDGESYLYGAIHEVVVPAGTKAPAVITWLRHDMLGIAGLESRLVSPVLEPWRSLLPSLQVVPGEEVLPGLLAGAGIVGADGDLPRVGYAFGGFTPWIWYVVQIRQRRSEGAVRLSQVVAKPDEAGRFVLSWDAPRDAAGIAGHEFRARDISQTGWLPWQRFEPSMSTLAPTVEWAAGNAAKGPQVRRHALSGLTAGETYRLQMRARNMHGYGAESAELQAQAAADGVLALAWTEPAGDADGHQVRLWWRAKMRWWPWQDLAVQAGAGHTPVDFLGRVRKDEDRLASARVAHELAGRVLRTSNRFTQMLDTSAMTRMAELGTVLRYAAAHPFGTGVYAPKRAHVGEGWPEWIVEELLRLWPHNQFLHVLVLFGVPGLLVLLAFYVCVLRAAIRCGGFVRRTQDDNLRFLALGVAAAWGAFTLNSLLIPVGSFIGGWSHFLLIGLLFSVTRLVGGSADAIVADDEPRGESIEPQIP